jgi:hypothetical protein
MRPENEGAVIDQAGGRHWHAYHGDCVEVARAMPDRSVSLAAFSPPFASLYTYSNSERDMGNARDAREFFAHFHYLVEQLARVMSPGRVVAMHCTDLPAMKERDGFVGLRDFPGELVRAFERTGWCRGCGGPSVRPGGEAGAWWLCRCGAKVGGFVFHSRVTIWKDPVTQMQRTKALGLLHKTVRENATMSRVGLPDYVVAVRAPGEVAVEDRVKHSADEVPVSDWQQIASPVWAVTSAEGVKAAIDPSDTLQYQSAREHEDERHICPLQLEVIRRVVMLWTNPGEVVFSPFMGIGSEGHVAVGGATRAGKRLVAPRKFIGAELKASYFKQAVANLRAAEFVRQPDLFDMGGA